MQLTVYCGNDWTAMGEEVFYDPEVTARSWAEVNLGTQKLTVNPPFLDYLELLNAVRWLVPRAMAYVSEEVFAAGWMDGIDKWMLDNYPEFRIAAEHLGSICTYWDGDDAHAGEWREY